MPAKNPGNLPFGSLSVSVTATGFTAQTYILSNVTVTQPSNVAEQMDADGDPNGQVLTPGFVTGSGVMQLATATTPPPPLFGEFPADLLKAGTEQNWVISEVGIEREQTGITKVPVSFRKLLS